MAVPAGVDSAQQLTDQRTNRLFVGSFSGLLAASDQSAAGLDDGTGTRTGQYQTRGQYGFAVEGKPVSEGQMAAIQHKRKPLWVGLGVAALILYLVVRK